MTFDQAIRHIRENAPETEDTFRIICRNRGCRPVRHWAIYDISEERKIPFESAERRYYRHLKRLHEIFGVSQVG